MTAKKLPVPSFALDRVVWDDGRRELVVLYTSGRGEPKTRAMETMIFGADGLVGEGKAMYGAPAQ